MDTLFHTAAYKHVILSEFNPFDVIQTNINGTENVIEAALANNVGTVIFTSSDKAVKPDQRYGRIKTHGRETDYCCQYHTTRQENGFCQHPLRQCARIPRVGCAYFHETDCRRRPGNAD